MPQVFPGFAVSVYFLPLTSAVRAKIKGEKILLEVIVERCFENIKLHIKKPHNATKAILPPIYLGTPLRTGGA